MGEFHITLPEISDRDFHTGESEKKKEVYFIVRPASASPSETFEIGFHDENGEERRWQISRYVAASMIECLANALAQTVI